jgi:hypothetical protein
MFSYRTGIRLLLASALMTVAATANAQNRHPQGPSFARPPASIPHFPPQFVGPRGIYGPMPSAVAPTWMERRTTPPFIGPSAQTLRARGNPAGVVAPIGPQRQPGESPVSPALSQREISSAPPLDNAAFGNAGQASVPLILRQMTGGSTLTGLSPGASGAVRVRGPLLSNPAFVRPPAHSNAAPILAERTFRGGFADRMQRPARRFAVIGWIGPLFWPFAFSDFIDYTFWPYAFDSFWPRAYDDVYEGLFGPYAVGDASADESASPYTGEPQLVGGGVPTARLKGEDLAQVCNGRVTGLTVWPIARIAKVVEPDDSQRAALDELKNTADRAIGLLRSACPTELPGTPTGRLAAMRSRLEIMLQAVEIVRPALERFYQLLSDEQKARFTIESQGRSATDTGPLTNPDSMPIEACREQVANATELPAARIAEAVRPTPEQQTAIDDLYAASVTASDLLKANCTEQPILTPPGRLLAIAQRLRAILQAVKTVQPALERFYTMLDNEQKARFNLLGVNRGQPPTSLEAVASP